MWRHLFIGAGPSVRRTVVCSSVGDRAKKWCGQCEHFPPWTGSYTIVLARIPHVPATSQCSRGPESRSSPPRARHSPSSEGFLLFTCVQSLTFVSDLEARLVPGRRVRPVQFGWGSGFRISCSHVHTRVASGPFRKSMDAPMLTRTTAGVTSRRREPFGLPLRIVGAGAQPSSLECSPRRCHERLW